MTDLYTRYETGLARLLEQLGSTHSRYNDALVMQHRLQENLDQTRVYGGTEGRRAGRAEILNQINHLSLQALGIPFHDLCERPATPPDPTPATDRTTTTASGDRSVAISSGAAGATIITGDVIQTGGSPTPTSDPAGLRDALAMARRALSILEQQAAGYTALSIPAHLVIELEEKRKQVAELEARLSPE